MRRKDREMDRTFALEVIDKCPYAVASIVLPDGLPYGIPLSIARIDDVIYFHCAPQGKKIDALLQNPHISIACVGHVAPRQDDFTTEYESAIVFGMAIRVDNDAEKIEALRAISLRYTPENMKNFDDAIARSLARTDVWKVRIDSISGKRKKYGRDGKEMKFGKME